MTLRVYIEQLPNSGEPKFRVRVDGIFPGVAPYGCITRREVYGVLGKCREVASEFGNGSVPISYGLVRSSERHNFDSHVGKKKCTRKGRKQITF